MLRRGVAASLTVALAFAISALASDVAEGSPFGKTTEQDAHQLLALAKSHGVDVAARQWGHIYRFSPLCRVSASWCLVSVGPHLCFSPCCRGLSP